MIIGYVPCGPINLFAKTYNLGLYLFIQEEFLFYPAAVMFLLPNMHAFLSNVPIFLSC